MNRDIILDLSDATDVPDLFNVSLNGIIVRPASGDFVADGNPLIPWDCDVTVEEGNLVLIGGVDSNGFGSAVIKLPKRSAHGYYQFVVEVDDSNMAAAMKLLFAAGIKISGIIG